MYTRTETNLDHYQAGLNEQNQTGPIHNQLILEGLIRAINRA